MIHTPEVTLKTMDNGGLTYHSPNEKVWIGVDFDGTLAYYDHWRGVEHCGEPIPEMVERVKGWLNDGKEVRIFTARVNDVLQNLWWLYLADQMPGLDINLQNKCGIDQIARDTIQQWCNTHLGIILPITNSKDYMMRGLWDDIAIQVITNTGETVAPEKRSEVFADMGAVPNDTV
jgi:hypothetical protein